MSGRSNPGISRGVMMLQMSMYEQWLERQGCRLYEGGGMYWRLYRGALVPGRITPCYPRLSMQQACRLLAESGALMVRYSSQPVEEATPWWYIVCDRYEPGELPSKVRSMIKRGLRNCDVHPIALEWLVEHGYECYAAAHKRYANALPLGEDDFRKNLSGTQGGPFEHWGVFVNGALAGYAQCIVEEKEVATDSIKYHPAYMNSYSSYALTATMAEHYVSRKACRLSNGNRSVAHDTNFQAFLLKLGFRQEYCLLNIVYSQRIRPVIRALYPFRNVLRGLPKSGAAGRLRSALLQEEIHRACHGR